MLLELRAIPRHDHSEPALFPHALVEVAHLAADLLGRAGVECANNPLRCLGIAEEAAFSAIIQCSAVA
jgi:hypothetical protein